MICKLCRADVEPLLPNGLCQGCAPDLRPLPPVVDFPTLPGRRRRTTKLPERPPTALKILRMEKGMADRGKPYTQEECAVMFDVCKRQWIRWEHGTPSRLGMERLWRLGWI